MLKKLTIVLGMAVAVAGTTTVSSFVFAPEAHAFGLKSIKKTAKKVGGKVKKGGKTVGRKAKYRGRLIKKAMTWKTTKEIGGDIKRGAKNAGRKTGRGAKRAGKVAGSVGKGFGKTGKCIVKRNCKNTIGPAQPGTRSNHDHRS